MIVRKTAAELEKMRQAGLLVWRILQRMKELAAPGITTLELETAAEKMIADAGAKPAFKGYYVPAAGEAFKFVLCTSVNSEIVHGMPNAKRVLKQGDIVSIDTGVKLDGYYGDSAITVPIGEVSEQTRKLLRVTQESLELAIDQVRAEIPKNARGRKVCFLAPGAGFGIKTEAVKARLVLGHRTEFPRVHKFLDGEEGSIPAAVLIDGQQPAALGREANELLRLCQSRRQGLIHDDMPVGFETSLRVREMRIVRCGYDNEIDCFIREQFVERARYPNLGILLLCVRAVPLENASQFHSFDAADDRGMKSLTRQTKSDKSHSYHDFSLCA